MPSLSRVGRVRTAPVASGDAPPPPASALTECLLLAGDSNETAADAAASMFDGMCVMTEVDMSWESENPASVGAGGASLYGGSDTNSGGGPSEGNRAVDGGVQGTASTDGHAAEPTASRKSKGKFGKKDKKGSSASGGRSAPPAKQFSAEQLRRLGLSVDSSGSLVEIDVPIPAGVTVEAVERCVAMGFNKAQAVGWLQRTDNNAEAAIEHLLAGHDPADYQPPHRDTGPPPAPSTGPPPPAGADGTRMVTMELALPAGVRGGQVLQVTTPSGKVISMAVPMGARPGMKIRFRITPEDATASQSRFCTLEVIVPPGAVPGQTIQVRAPNGEVISVQVPHGARNGQRIQFQVDNRYSRKPITLELLVPPGSMPGQLITIADPQGRQHTVQIPNNATPGSRIRFQVPG